MIVLSRVARNKPKANLKNMGVSHGMPQVRGELTRIL